MGRRGAGGAARAVPARTIPLRVLFSGRTADVAWLLTAIVAWAAVAGIVVTGAVVTLEHVDAGQRLESAAWFTLFVAVVVVPAVGATRTWRRRRADGGPAISLLADRLVIAAPAVLARPLEVRFTEVMVAAVDDRQQRARLWAEGLRRFPVGAALGLRPTWLYTTWGRSRLPLIGYGSEVPDLVLLFRSPRRLPSTRRPHLLWRLIDLGARVRPARLPEEARGLLLRVDSPDHARQLLSEAGLLGDVERLDPVALGLAEPGEPAPAPLARDPALAPEEADRSPGGVLALRTAVVVVCLVATTWLTWAAFAGSPG